MNQSKNKQEANKSQKQNFMKVHQKLINAVKLSSSQKTGKSLQSKWLNQQMSTKLQRCKIRKNSIKIKQAILQWVLATK